MSWADANSIPVAYKRWLIERVSKELKQTSDNGQTATKAIEGNRPNVRAAQGRQRTDVPARLRRFS